MIRFDNCFRLWRLNSSLPCQMLPGHNGEDKQAENNLPEFHILVFNTNYNPMWLIIRYSGYINHG